MCKANGVKNGTPERKPKGGGGSLKAVGFLATGAAAYYGAPIVSAAIAEPLAKNGETVMSPQAWEHARGTVIEGAPVAERPEFHRARCGLVNHGGDGVIIVRNGAKLEDCRPRAVCLGCSLQQLDHHRLICGYRLQSRLQFRQL